jgi:hypothetical protein
LAQQAVLLHRFSHCSEPAAPAAAVIGALLSQHHKSTARQIHAALSNGHITVSQLALTDDASAMQIGS